ncbi:phosphatidylinositol transfer protein csr1 [Pleosporales sp. CAS-2024a]
MIQDEPVHTTIARDPRESHPAPRRRCPFLGTGSGATTPLRCSLRAPPLSCMFRRAGPLTRQLRGCFAPLPKHYPFAHPPVQLAPRLAVDKSAFCTDTRYPSGTHSAPDSLRTSSASASGTIAIVVGLAIGGALLVLPVQNSPARDLTRHDSGLHFDPTTLPDSYLVMAPSTPPGRPGTLTAEEEKKLRDLWVMTLKVFGVDASVEEANGADAPAAAAAAAATSDVGSEKDGKKDKKKSRLNVFRRHKDDKTADTKTPVSPGTATAADISSLSLSVEDDKFGQTAEFKAAIANTPPEELRSAFWSMVKHDHPDALLLRFLRARKWDVEKALIMMISTMHWRLSEMHVDDDIVKNGESKAMEDSKATDAKVKKNSEDFLTQLRMGKSYLHGLDSEGRPMCFTIVFDMTDFSMANMDYTPVKFMIKCFEANYPESLGTVLVYKAPWVFNAVWSIVRGWLDPVVAGKVHFAKNIDELQKFVPRNQIPSELGGDEQWTYEYPEPVPGEDEKMKDEAAKASLETERAEIVKRYEKTVIEWIHDADKEMDDQRNERNMVAEELRKNYWQLDPYVRARTLYDRMGVLNEGGQLAFYPPTQSAPAASKVSTSADDLD